MSSIEMSLPADAEAQQDSLRQRQSRCSILQSRNDDGYRSDRESKREGRVSVNEVIALIDYGQGAEYGDTSAPYWNLYLSEAEINDKNFVESLESDTRSIALVNTLFSSFVASFIIEIYKTLKPDNGQQTSNAQTSPAVVNIQSFKPPSIAIRMNIVMFLSLFLSMMSVVMSALIQQWCREFMKHAYPSAPPHKRGRVRTFLFKGLDLFQMRRLMYGVQMLLHLSIFLFFWAVSDFLYTVYQPVGTFARYSLLTSLVIYMAFSISPLIFINSPYHTPLTPPLRSIGRLILLIVRTFWRFLPNSQELPHTFLEYFKGIHFDRVHHLVDEADSQAESLDNYAIEWLFTEDDLSDDSMDTFLEALPRYILSRFTDQTRLAEQLSASYIIRRIREHLLTCVIPHWLSEEACIARVSACVNSLRLIFETSSSHTASKDKESPQRTDTQDLIKGLDELCREEDQMVALRASCVRGLAFQVLLPSHPIPHDVLVTPDFPDYLSPLLSFVDKHKNKRQPSNGVPSSEGHNSPRNSEENERMWETLLHDGPLVNLTRVAEDILEHYHVQSESLSLCWKTLETLLKEFSIARMKVSEAALQRFNKVLENAHDRIQVEHHGFRLTPLLETLDTVARGRRLSMVFLDHPNYYGRADVIFGKEQLQNSDLMEVFASCLPRFIAKIPQEERREFMEAMVCEDGLWTSLQVNLRNAVRLEKPIPDKLRIFEACCTVIDAMFFALEASDKVDWRAPDFGLLAQHFEMFVTNCFKDTFVGRAIGFRVGLIKLRFCKAVLTRFYKEASREGAVSLRSQWDVAALARVFYTLEVGSEEDVAFWLSFTNGGQIGAEFMIEVRKMLDIAIRDGPLLSFCKLGHLALTAVPFDGSGLGLADIEKVQVLQEALLEDKHLLPLSRASPAAWNELNRLRREVCDVLKRSPDKERGKLKQLLQSIDRANDLYPDPLQYLPLNSTELSAHTPSHNDETSPHNLPLPQPAVHDHVTSGVVKGIQTVSMPI